MKDAWQALQAPGSTSPMSTPYSFPLRLRLTAGPLKRDADTRHYPADYLREAVLLIVIVSLSNRLDTLAAIA